MVFSILRVEQSSSQSNFRTFYHPPPKIPYSLVVQSLSRVRLFATPWTACSTPGFPVLHYLLKFLQTHVHWISDATQTTHPSVHSHFPHLPIFSSAAAAAVKLLQSCPTLCDPIDGSPPGSSVPGILQATILEWVAISFSNAWKWKVKVKLLSHVRL